MFQEIFLFEVKSAFKRPSTYLYFALFFGLTLLLGLTVSEVFANTRSDSNMYANSAMAVAAILLSTGGSIFSIIVSVLLIGTVGTVIQKDYQYNIHPIFFTKPISKSGYFFGRFLAGICVALFIFTSMVLGYYIGTLFGMGKPMMGPYKLVNYVQPFLLFTLPNVFLFGVIFFSLTTYLRSTMPAYIFAIVLMVLQLMTGVITQKIENKSLAALLEPTGMAALGSVSEYWTPDERNHNIIPFSGAILYNRLLWSGIAIAICAISYWGFSFSQFLQPLKLFRRKAEAQAAPVVTTDTLADLPKVQQQFSAAANRSQLWYLSKFEFKKMVSSTFFIIMCLLGLGLMLLIVNFMDVMYDAPTYLVTYKVLEQIAGGMSLFTLIFIIFYSGTTVWRDKETKMDELMGVTPVSNSTLFFSKFFGLTMSFMILFIIAALGGIALQLYTGFYQIDILQYIVFLFKNLAIGVVFAGFCLAMQVYMPNKYLGFVLSLVPIMFIPIILGIFEINNPLLDFNDSGNRDPYSDMNGWGGTFIQWPYFRGYWYSITGILILLAILLYPRGKEKGFKARWKLSRYFNNSKYQLLMSLFGLMAIGFGAFIIYQTKFLVDVQKPKDREKRTAEMEKMYKHYQYTPQPRITDVNVYADIFTKSRELSFGGTYVLTNRNAVPVDTLFLNIIGGKKSAYSYPVLSISKPGTLIKNDIEFGYRIYKLTQPLMPGDTMLLTFKAEYKPRGIFDKTNSPVVGNGTFINSQLMPSIGYNEGVELSQNTARKEYGLPRKERMAPVFDSVARMNNYISNDADFINFQATVSTDEGQTAIAPGYLQKEWVKDGRHYFSYKMDSPILNFYSFLSAKYQVRKDKWNDVNIEIYYHKGHEYNIDRMIKGIKKSLDYYTVNFGPYQHKQVRIIEFPRYSSFAQSFPNTIPYSESIGFITKVEQGPDKIDVPFYVTAHEVAHQWWAHQVIGGNVQGSVLMSETMSQYAALMVMEKEYGKNAMKKFLKYEMDKYLQGRTMEWRGETPLMLCENQAYIHYNKGSVVMYALKDYLGEDVLNSAVRNYLNKFKFKGPMYSNSIDFVSEIDKVTPDSLKYLLEDMMGKITVYENYVKALDVKALPNNQWQVKLEVGSAKFYADSIGKQVSGNVNDYIDVAVFGKKKDEKSPVENPLVFQRIKMDAPVKTFEFVVNEKPEYAGIDPYLKLIDRTPKNNTLKVGEKAPKVNLDPGKPGMDIGFKIGDDED